MKIIFLLLMGTGFARGDDVLCTDVALYDLQNSVISVKDDQALSVQTTDQDALPFKNGAAQLKDDPTSEKDDWRYEMVGDFVMRPVRNVKVRVIRIFENHLSGSGSWDRLMAFRCTGGRLEKIWQRRFDQGVKVKRLNELQFKVTTLSKVSKKSLAKSSDLGVYRWDNKHTTFTRR